MILDHPQPLFVRHDDIPVPLAELVGRMISKEPSSRLPAMDDVADDLLAMGAEMGLGLKRHVVTRAT